MKTLLTPQLLGFLIERGYTYCFAKTQALYDGRVRIMLTPVKGNPELACLPEGQDSCFKITREPMQMAYGIEGTEIYVSLGTDNSHSHTFTASPGYIHA
jgi:hypothetical protein